MKMGRRPAATLMIAGAIAVSLTPVARATPGAGTILTSS